MYIYKAQRKYQMKLRESMFDILGYKCVICGFKDIRALQIDHIKGGGAKEQKNMNGNSGMYRYYKNNPDKAKKKLQILCANCNWIKKHSNNENRK